MAHEDRSTSRPESSARAEAIRLLERIEEDESYASRVLEGVGLSGRAARQATEYVYGITRWRRWLDFLLASFYHGDYEAMEPTLRQVLRLGLYDLLMLHTPPHAAINEAVELAKRLVRPGAGGLTNGILRSVQRQQDVLPQPDTGDAAEDLAIRQSHPTWMVRRWLERYGRESTEALLEWNNRRPSYGLRRNTLQLDADRFEQMLDEAEIDWAPSPYLDDFVRVERLQPVLKAGWLKEGRCSVQDESAGLVVCVLDPKPDEELIDACAAPGGKALYAAERMQGRGHIQAYDVHENRLRLLERTVARLGLEMVSTEAGDLRELVQRSDAPQADRVLVDAPCSGMGVLAKRADLRWQRTQEDLDELARLQDELLDAAASLVRPGGLLVYSTCTIEPEENEQRVEAFLERHEAFERESLPEGLPASMTSPEGYFASLPQRDEIDGAFAVRLRRSA